MSLIKCPECKKKISSEASNCPKCGFPIQGYECENEHKVKSDYKETIKVIIAKKSTKILLILGIVVIVCLSFFVYHRTTTSGITRGANNCSVTTVKLNEMFKFDTALVPETGYYWESTRTYDEDKGVFHYTHTEKDEIEQLTYSGGKFIDIPAIEIKYYFDEHKQVCKKMIYYIDKNNRDAFIKSITKRIDEECGEAWQTVDMGTYSIFWHTSLNTIVVEIEFK